METIKIIALIQIALTAAGIISIMSCYIVDDPEFPIIKHGHKLFGVMWIVWFVEFTVFGCVAIWRLL